MKSRPKGRRAHAPAVRLAAVTFASAALLAACGGKATSAAATTTIRRSSTTASSARSAGTTAPTAGSTSTTQATSALPPVCSLLTVAQASAALGATVTEVKPTDVGSKTGCKWVVKASSLVTGLGSNIVLGLVHPTTSSRSAYYKELENLTPLHFKPVAIDGIPGVAGFGADNEVQVDVGPTVVDLAALSTVSTAKDATAAEQAATYAVEALCQKISCQR